MMKILSKTLQIDQNENEDFFLQRIDLIFSYSKSSCSSCSCKVKGSFIQVEKVDRNSHVYKQAG